MSDRGEAYGSGQVAALVASLISTADCLPPISCKRRCGCPRANAVTETFGNRMIAEQANWG
ncbi:hypothetical protein [Lactococcus fujiensis]|uniref:hypothetical protein n=1 Tax=Lactococcus fujiensis TaxID=610251 RepID=UPI0006CF9F45|nr:hypothetical protein [Lactococcus fujiensis]